MKCEMCKKNDANVRYTEVVHKKVVKMNLCEECAKKKGITIQAPFSIADLLSGLTDVGLRSEEDSKNVCEGCGMTFAEFRKNGRLGCDRCYRTFEASLRGLLESIHRSATHVGKVPLRARAEADHAARLKDLEERLCAAVGGEEFEAAAELRDEIQALKKEMRSRIGNGRKERARS